MPPDYALSGRVVLVALALLLVAALPSPMADVRVVHNILLSFPKWHGDTESTAEREARLGIVAAAIVVASEGDRERAIALMVQAKNESNLAAHIHRGECEGHPESFFGECDAAWIKQHGRKVRVWRARNVWQVHSAPRADLAALWERSLGADLASTTSAARLADYYLRARRCGGDLVAMYAAQGGRPGCVKAPSGEKRAAMHKKLRAQWSKLSREVTR